MKITKIIKDGLSSGPMSPVNELRVEGLYPSVAEAQAQQQQHIHGLESLLKVYCRAFGRVTGFESPEGLSAIGVDYAKKVAAHITIHGIQMEIVELTFRKLLEAK